jgi:hypothetical protein
MRKFKSLALIATCRNSQDRLKVCSYGFVMLKDRRTSLQRTRMRRGIALSSRHLLRLFDRSFLLISPIGRVLMSFRSFLIHLDPSRRTRSRSDRVWKCKQPSRIRGFIGLRFRHPSDFGWGSCLNHPLCLQSKNNLRYWQARLYQLSKPSFPARSIDLRWIGLGIHLRQINLCLRDSLRKRLWCLRIQALQWLALRGPRKIRLCTRLIHPTSSRRLCNAIDRMLRFQGLRR